MKVSSTEPFYDSSQMKLALTHNIEVDGCSVFNCLPSFTFGGAHYDVTLKPRINRVHISTFYHLSLVMDINGHVNDEDFAFRTQRGFSAYPTLDVHGEMGETVTFGDMFTIFARSVSESLLYPAYVNAVEEERERLYVTGEYVPVERALQEMYRRGHTYIDVIPFQSSFSEGLSGRVFHTSFNAFMNVTQKRFHEMNQRQRYSWFQSELKHCLELYREAQETAKDNSCSMDVWVKAHHNFLTALAVLYVLGGHKFPNSLYKRNFKTSWVSGRGMT